MIQTTVRKNKKHVLIRMTGHAGYAKYGQDIVCSAASTLIFHTANALKHVDVSDKPDLLMLRAQITNYVDRAFVMALLHTLKAIEKQYPKNLKVVYERPR